MTKEVAEKIVRGITDKIECNIVDIDDWAEFWGFTREEYEEFLDTAVKVAGQKPYEKFESTKDHIYKLAGDYKCWDNRLTQDEALELYHILEREPILDKIRAEIAVLDDADYDYEGYYKAITDALQIIDKYKIENEVN